MDSDEEHDFADQGPLTDMDMEEDAEMFALLLKHMPSCIDAADIEQLVRDIPEQPPVVPVRTVQEAVAGWRPSPTGCRWRSKGGLSIRFANPIHDAIHSI
jgi:hypothetical protein